MKTAVIFWSGTGNTEAMANAVAEGAGVQATAVGSFDGDLSEYEAIALGCPAMGAEELEDSEFEPFYTANEAKLAGKPVALFGSYDWGDGEWMRLWTDRAKAAGAKVVDGEGLICNKTPADEALAKCRALGAKLAKGG